MAIHLRARALRAAVGALLLAAIASAGCMSDRERAGKHVERARQYLDEELRDEAVLELQSALQRDPESEDANTLLAGVALSEGRYSDALSLFSEAHRAAPDSAQAALNLARLLQQDDPEGARQLVERAIRRDPDNPLGYIGRAELALGRGKTREALKAAKRAAELAPEDPRVQWELGSVYGTKIRERRRLGLNPSDSLYTEALEALARYAELSGENLWKVELQRAEVFGAWPEHERDAVESYRRALEWAEAEASRNGRRQVAQRAALFSSTTRDADFQEWALQELVSSSPDDLQAWFLLARLRARRGGSAEEVLQQMLTQQADNPEAHIRWAEHLVSRGRFQQALDYLEEKADEEIDPPRLLAAVANLQLAARRSQDSRRTTKLLEARYPDHPWTILQVAQLSLREGKLRLALDALRKLTVEHESIDALRMLAEVELLAGNHKRALRAVNRATQLTRGFAHREQRLRARILAGQGEYGRVRRVLQELHQRQPLSPEERILLATAYYETGEPTQGRKLLEKVLSAKGAPAEAAIEFAAREGSKPEAREEARRHLTRALARDPTHLGALDAVVILDIESGEVDQALARLDLALEQRPGSAHLLLRRAGLRAHHGNSFGAMVDARAAFERQPNLPGALRLVTSLIASQGRLEAAVASLERADQSERSIKPNTRVLLARLYLLSGDEAAARAAYEKALADGSVLAEAKKDLAFLLTEAAETDPEATGRALKLAREAVVMLPNDAEAIDTLGLVYLRRGDPETALSHFQAALQLVNPAEPRIHYHLGLALGALDRDQEAIEAFEAALGIDANFREAAAARRQLELAREAGDTRPDSG